MIRWSLRRRGLVLGLMFLLLAVSVYRVPQMPIEVFPELNAPTVTIMTEAPGYAPEEVERAVSFQIETALNGIAGLRRLRSSSALGLSIVWAEFDFGADIYRNRQLIAERLTRLQGVLPANIHTPEMTPVASIAGEVMLLGLTSPDGSVSPLELRSLAEFDLRPRLLAITGVAQITALGGELPEFQIQVRAEDLQRHGLSLAQVEQATAASHAPVGAGYLADVGGRELPLRPEARVAQAADIAATVVGTWQGTPVRLSQVAAVGISGAPRRGTGSAGGQPAVILTVQRNPDANTLELTRRIDAVLDAFSTTIPTGVKLERAIFRQADFIGVAVDNVLVALRDASFFVVIVLLLFLLNVRTTLITLAALPLSLGSALLVLDAFGATVNVMTLGGIAVAIGSLVDDAIVDVENVFRRLRQNAALPAERRQTTLHVVYEASREVRQAILLATAVIVLVFVPLFFLGGVEGRFFRPLGAAYVISLGASLVVAMTVTPVLCYYLLRNAPALSTEREGWLVRWLKRLYGVTLRGTLRARHAVFLVCGVLLAGSLALVATFGSSFLPEFNEGSITLFLNTPAGTSLSESNRIARQIELQAGRIEGVAAVTRRTGRAEQDEHAEPVSASEVDIRLEPGADVTAVRRDLSKLLDATPGLTKQIGGPIGHRLSHILSGTPAAVAIKVFGDDLDALRAVARQIEQALAPLPGVRDLVANREVLTDTLPIRFDRERLAHYGLTPADAAAQLETAFLGKTMGVVNRGSARLDIVLRLAHEERQTVDDVGRFLLRAPSGALVRVGSVAELTEEQASSLITRENVRRKAVISCNVADGHNLGDLIVKIRERVDPILASREGMYVEYGGQFEAQEEASRRILWASVGVLALIFLILYAAFGSARPVLLVLLNLPLALVGGVVALFLADSPSLWRNVVGLFGGGGYVPPVVSIPALVGFIGLAGVACRNGLLLISHYYQLMEQEGVSKSDAVVRGAEERLVPILMTALSSALALIPLVLAKGEIGSELQYPIAVVILGGLVSSTFLNLFVVPVGFQIFGGGPRNETREAIDLSPTQPGPQPIRVAGVVADATIHPPTNPMTL
ncbi:MAG: efflux RND transporter permease subunit [Planctomycetes bacterium]|nr:efflux RND transporter permease subunit [Planctomycetota bacterium]